MTVYQRVYLEVEQKAASMADKKVLMRVCSLVVAMAASRVVATVAKRAPMLVASMVGTKVER